MHGNGVLSREDIRYVLGKLNIRVDLDELMDRVDTNKDGSIDYDGTACIVTFKLPSNMHRINTHTRIALEYLILFDKTCKPEHCIKVFVQKSEFVHVFVFSCEEERTTYSTSL